MKVRIQVIKVYDIEVDAQDSEEAILKAYNMQTTEIEATGRLVDALTDFAETEDEIEEDLKMLCELGNFWISSQNDDLVSKNEMEKLEADSPRGRSPEAVRHRLRPPTFLLSNNF